MAFTETNAATGKTWTRDELFAQLRKTEAQLQATSDLLAEATCGPDRFVTWNDQLMNLRSRWERHTEEFGLAKHDAMQLGLEARKWFDTIVSELSQPVLKS